MSLAPVRNVMPFGVGRTFGLRQLRTECVYTAIASAPVVLRRTGQIPQDRIGAPLRMAGQVLFQSTVLVVGQRVLRDGCRVSRRIDRSLVRIGRGLTEVRDFARLICVAAEPEHPIVRMRLLRAVAVAVPAPPLPGQLIAIGRAFLELVHVIWPDVERLIHVDRARAAPQSRQSRHVSGRCRRSS